jgi:hypothetical protein
MIDQIKYIEGFMPADIALKISDYAKTYTDDFLEYGNGEKEFTVHTHNEIASRDKEVLFLMQEYARKVYDFVLSNYQGPFQDFIDEKTHIAKFVAGKGMHEHFDSSRPNDIATLIYLNDDYIGGDIYFPKYEISYKPKPGDLLCFPDNPDYVHGVKVIDLGTRYTAPRWFTRIV